MTRVTAGFLCLGVALLSSLLFGLPIPAGAQLVGPNVNVSRAADDQTEPAIAIDPTNPARMFIASNTRFEGLFAAYSTNAGVTWFWTDPSDGTIADGRDGLPEACCDPWLSAACDPFGNIFLVYLKSTSPSGIIIVLSTNGGRSFRALATLASGHDVDKPTLATGCSAGSVLATVWVSYKDFSLGGTPLLVHSAVVTNLGIVSTFSTGRSIPGAANGSFGDIAVGPAGQVLVAYQDTFLDEGPSTIYVSLDPDGRGAAAFGSSVAVATVGAGAFELIPAAPERGVYANPTLAWDNNSASPFFGRVYMSYTDEVPDESDNTDIFVRYSNNNGASWSAPVRVNDDATTRSQFFSRIAVDPTSGLLAVSWYDCRNDNGSGPDNRAPGANNDAQFYAAISADGGQTWSPNVRVSQGTSTESASQNSNDYGDYTALAFHGGAFYPVWADNSNSTGDNPDGASGMELYTARITVGVGLAGAALVAEGCSPTNGVIDSGEEVTVNVSLRNAGGGPTTNVVATLLASGGVAAPSSPQSYGALVSGAAAVARPFTFRADGACGDQLTATLQLQDGPTDLGAFSVAFSLGTVASTAHSFDNPNSIAIVDASPATPYPSTISVSGFADTFTRVTVTLHNVSHTFPDDLDVLLVGPGGQKVVLMSDAGGSSSLGGVTLTFDDAASVSLPDAGLLVTGAYRPANYSTGGAPDTFPGPAPSGPYGSSLAVFNGINPNGTWSLYVVDDAQEDFGAISGGWSVNFVNTVTNCCASPPSLTITRAGSEAIINWPTSALGFTLEAKPVLDPALPWAGVTSPIVTNNGMNSVVVPAADGNRFFRLRQ